LCEALLNICCSYALQVLVALRYCGLSAAIRQPLNGLSFAELLFWRAYFGFLTNLF
jgi:hypothetical protein